jgi:carboxyl-terminal processing protease
MGQLRFSQFKRLGVVSLLGLLSLLILQWFATDFSIAERSQMAVFEQVGQTVKDNFYDPNLNGVDWNAIREKYKSQAMQAQSTAELAPVINQMLAELQTSHTRFYTQAEPAYYQLLAIFQADPDLRKQFQKYLPNGSLDYVGIGVFTKNSQGNTFVSGILEKSPAAESGLKVGDQLLSVENQLFQPIQSFVGKAGQKVTLQVQRTANPRSRQEITVTPRKLNPSQMFLDAQKASVELIERDGKQIGYVHIWSYAGEQYQQQLEEDLIYGRLQAADGLVLDLRDGWGGASPSYLNFFTAKGPSFTVIGRDRKHVSRNYQWTKPVVMLVNEGSRSGKEILAFGFQRYQIGAIVGTKTAAAVVAGRPFLMQDGSLLYLAVADVLVDGERLEGKGVTPDISVSFPLAYAQGADPQKAQAIATVLAAIKP